MGVMEGDMGGMGGMVEVPTAAGATVGQIVIVAGTMDDSVSTLKFS